MGRRRARRASPLRWIAGRGGWRDATGKRVRLSAALDDDVERVEVRRVDEDIDGDDPAVADGEGEGGLRLSAWGPDAAGVAVDERGPDAAGASQELPGDLRRAACIAQCARGGRGGRR